LNRLWLDNPVLTTTATGWCTTPFAPAYRCCILRDTGLVRSYGGRNACKAQLNVAALADHFGPVHAVFTARTRS
jgi:hypothetical protein